MVSLEYYTKLVMARAARVHPQRPYHPLDFVRFLASLSFLLLHLTSPKPRGDEVVESIGIHWNPQPPSLKGLMRYRSSRGSVTLSSGQPPVS